MDGEQQPEAPVEAQEEAPAEQQQPASDSPVQDEGFGQGEG